MITQSNGLVAIYASSVYAKTAILNMQQSGYSLRKLSIFGRVCNGNEHMIGPNTACRIAYRGIIGLLWGRIWDKWVDSAVLLMPQGVNPYLVAGPLLGRITKTPEPILTANNVTGSILGTLGISQASAHRYDSAIKTGMFAVIVNGSTEDAARARKAVYKTDPKLLEDHDFYPTHHDTSFMDHACQAIM